MKRQPDWPALLLLIAVFFGGLVRFMPALVTRFPLNDGGMFYTMAQELSANGYALPTTTSYNGLDLPFAYPPLGLYLASLLADVGRIPPFAVFLWLPPILATLAIPAFYLFSRALLADKLRASLATLFFALTPGSYDWHLMGGGVTRALGFLFLLLAAFYVLRFFQRQQSDIHFRSDCHFALAILFCSLAVLSHPEVGLQTAGLCAVLWLFFGRTWRGTLDATFVVLGVFLLTAPWWGTVISQQGLAPFLSALQTGQHATIDWSYLYLSLFGSGEFIPLLLVLRFAGLFYAIWKREYLLLSLLFIPAVLDPRSAASIALLAFSMMSALGFLDLLPTMKKLYGGELRPILTYRLGAGTLLLVAFILFVECGLLNYRLVNTTLTAGERSTMGWLNDNLPPDQNFILVTGRTYSMSDPAQEWFPVFSGQHSQSTLQGLEWTLGAEFTDRLNDLAVLQACDDFSCVEKFAARTGLAYDYIWVSIPTIRTNPEQNARGNQLADSIQSSNQFSVVFDELLSSERIVIFQRQNK
ncbi:MAG: hypothetical protein ACOYZ6_01795 [Chloroflexota bacterium]